MNIHDFEAERIEGDRLVNIFKRQEELYHKYHHIEKGNGFYCPDVIPVNLHSAKDQAVIKDHFWRFLEEIGEAMDALDDGHIDHCHEELADALHFFVEACIVIGLEPLDMVFDSVDGVDMLEQAYAMNPINKPHNPLIINLTLKSLVKSLDMSANCLKNKPWKQSQMMTDEEEFKGRVIKTFHRFISFVKACGIMNPQDLFDLYFRKSQVNIFRQNSKY